MTPVRVHPLAPDFRCTPTKHPILIAFHESNLYRVHMSRSAAIAVLTGDLVRSTEMTPRDMVAAMDALGHTAQTIALWPGMGPLHFTRHRGDGWQVALPDPRFAIRAALLFRASLKVRGAEFDSAIAIATGVAEGPVGPDLNRETGGPFVLSGRALDDRRRAPRGKEPRLLLADPELAGGPVGAAVLLLDRVATGWTEAQAQALMRALPPDPPDVSAIAERLGKSRQAVAKALAAAWGAEVTEALARIEGSWR